MQSKFHLILGSQSPRRIALFNQLDVPYLQLSSDVDERSDETDPIKYAIEASRRKLNSIWSNLPAKYTANTSFNPLLVCSDTLGMLGNKILLKPKDSQDAFDILKQLSGRSHMIYTSVIYRFANSDDYSFVEESKVSFKKLSDKVISEYVATGEPLDKAGAYGIQGAAKVFVESIEGNYSNIVGFPMDPFIESLKNCFNIEEDPIRELFHQERWL